MGNRHDKPAEPTRASYRPKEVPSMELKDYEKKYEIKMD